MSGDGFPGTGDDAGTSGGADGSDPNNPGPSPQSIQLAVVNPDVPVLATFQSHSPKIYCYQTRCFLAYLEHRSNPADTRPDVFDIRLRMSSDSGVTFSSFGAIANAQARAPAIVGDNAGNVYVLYPDNVTDTAGYVHFLRYSSTNGYSAPVVNVSFARGGTGKFTAAYYAWTNRIYYFTNVNSWGTNDTPNLFALDPNGGVLAEVMLTSAEYQTGPLRLRGNHYPYLAVNGSTLIAAWTSTNEFATYIQGLPPYESIHAIKTEDGGNSWLTLANQPLATPVLGTLAGPATRITYSDETNAFAHKWLSNIIAYGGSLHFSYLTRPSPDREHYVRVNLASGAFTANYFPAWSGGSTRIHSLDGVFVDGGAALYAIGADDATGQLVVLASSDAGTSWHDHAAVAIGTAGCQAYGIDAHRKTLPNGTIVGVFTRICPNAPNALVRFVVAP